MIWEKDGSSVEIRTFGELPEGRPALDEIVATGAFVHLEQMSHDHRWMGLEAGGRYFHLNFGVQEGHLWVRLSDQSDDGPEWEGDHRERRRPGGPRYGHGGSDAEVGAAATTFSAASILASMVFSSPGL